MNNENNSGDENARLWVLFAMLALMIALWVFSGWWINHYSGGDATKRGTFGDMFGAINALFSGAAFAGVIYTILLQRKELRLQLQELKRTAEAQEKAAKLSAYTGMLATYNQSVQYVHQLLLNHPSHELDEQYHAQVKERDYYACKVAELVGEELKQRD